MATTGPAPVPTSNINPILPPPTKSPDAVNPAVASVPSTTPTIVPRSQIDRAPAPVVPGVATGTSVTSINSEPLLDITTEAANVTPASVTGNIVIPTTTKPGGLSYAVQYNANGVFGGTGQFEWDVVNGLVKIGNSYNGYKPTDLFVQGNIMIGEVQSRTGAKPFGYGYAEIGRIRYLDDQGFANARYPSVYGFSVAPGEPLYENWMCIVQEPGHETSTATSVVLGQGNANGNSTLFGLSVNSTNARGTQLNNPYWSPIYSDPGATGWQQLVRITGKDVFMPQLSEAVGPKFLAYNTANGRITYTDGVGNSSITVQEEGSNVVSASTINFVGSGVTASNVGGVATITVPGGITGVAVQEEGTNVVASANRINFVGSGVTASNVSGVATITITGGNAQPAGNIYEIQYNSGAGTFAASNNLYYTGADGLYLRNNLNLVTTGEHYTKWRATANSAPAWQLGVYTSSGSEAWELYGPGHDAVLTAFPTGNILFWNGYGGEGFSSGNANAGITIGSDIRFVNLGNVNPADGHAGIYFADGTYQYTAATGSAITIKDEGTNVVTGANTLNFVGAGVTASNVGGVATITVSGGGSGITVQEESSTVVATATTVNFLGAGVTASNVGGVAVVTVPGGVNTMYDGSPVTTPAQTINFTGPLANVTNVGFGTDTTDVTIGLTVQDESTVVTGNAAIGTLNFLGAGVTVTAGPTGVANITIPSGGGTPGSPNASIQFNDNGSFAGNTYFTFNKTNGNVDMALGNLTVSNGNITGKTNGIPLGYKYLPGNSVTGNRDISSSDIGGYIVKWGNSDITLTTPGFPGDSNLPVGTKIEIFNANPTGNANIFAGSGGGTSTVLVGPRPGAAGILTYVQVGPYEQVTMVKLGASASNVYTGNSVVWFCYGSAVTNH